MTSAAPLLATKLFVPRPRGNRVSRDRLRARLDATEGGSLTLVSAPAGTGKSTLLADWASNANARVAWVSLEDGDDDTWQLMNCIVASLRDSGAIDDRDFADGWPSTPGPQEPVLTELMNAIALRPEPITLILDDYHVVGSGAAHAAVQFLIDHLPPNLHLVISTRSDPPLALSRLRALHTLVELRASDLRFTLDEARSFLNDSMSLGLDEEQIAQLEQKTEGWVVGLQMAALSLRTSAQPGAFVSGFSGTNRFVLDYLIEEVLAQQPEATRMFLLQTSILERLSAPLCAAVTGRSDGGEMLRMIESSNLFVIPLDDARFWYRYHHLFAKVLEHQLASAMDAAGVAELHQRASAWFAANGFIEQALHHSLAANDAERAVSIVNENASQLIAVGQSALLVRWVALLPDESVREKVDLLLLYALALTGECRLDVARDTLQQVETILGAQEAKKDGRYLVAGGFLDRMTGRHAEADAALVHAMDMLQPDTSWRALASLNLGLGAHWAGQFRRAEVVLEEARRQHDAPDQLSAALIAQAITAFDHLIRGYPEEAMTLAVEGCEWAERARGGASPLAALSYCVRAEVHNAWNEPEKARELALRGMEHGRRMLIGYFDCARAFAGAMEALGDFEAALKAMSDVARAIRYLGNSVWEQLLVIVQQRIVLRRGIATGSTADLASVGRWIESRGDYGTAWSQRRRLPAFFGDDAFVTTARFFVEDERYTDAIALCTMIEEDAVACENVITHIEALVVRAHALARAGQSREAATALDKARAIAAAPRFIRPFAIEEIPVDATEADTRKGVADTEGLSERELEVLQLVASGASNAETARKLLIASGTVKKHLENIYAKLGVGGRVQAIARARELRLL